MFTLGGSWSGGEGGKNGEIYDPTDPNWALLKNVKSEYILTDDPRGMYRADNHGWFFAWEDNEGALPHKELSKTTCMRHICDVSHAA